jgi:hypothetical protein
MTEEEKAREIEEKLKAADSRTRADAETGEKLDKLLKFVDSVGETIGKIHQRMDALEAKTPVKDDDDETKAPETMADSEDEDPNLSIGERNKKRREQGQELTDAQRRADAVAHLFGQQAPRPMAGELPIEYRRRILREFQRHSPEFKAVDLKTLKGDVLSAVESRIYADATEIGRRPPRSSNSGAIRGFGSIRRVAA